MKQSMQFRRNLRKKSIAIDISKGNESVLDSKKRLAFRCARGGELNEFVRLISSKVGIKEVQDWSINLSGTLEKAIRTQKIQKEIWEHILLKLTEKNKKPTSTNTASSSNSIPKGEPSKEKKQELPENKLSQTELNKELKKQKFYTLLLPIFEEINILKKLATQFKKLHVFDKGVLESILKEQLYDFISGLESTGFRHMGEVFGDLVDRIKGQGTEKEIYFSQKQEAIKYKIKECLFELDSLNTEIDNISEPQIQEIIEHLDEEIETSSQELYNLRKIRSEIDSQKKEEAKSLTQTHTPLKKRADTLTEKLNTAAVGTPQHLQAQSEKAEADMETLKLLDTPLDLNTKDERGETLADIVSRKRNLGHLQALLKEQEKRSKDPNNRIDFYAQEPQPALEETLVSSITSAMTTPVKTERKESKEEIFTTPFGKDTTLQRSLSFSCQPKIQELKFSDMTNKQEAIAMLVNDTINMQRLYQQNLQMFAIVDFTIPIILKELEDSRWVFNGNETDLCTARLKSWLKEIDVLKKSNFSPTKDEVLLKILELKEFIKLNYKYNYGDSLFVEKDRTKWCEDLDDLHSKISQLEHTFSKDFPDPKIQTVIDSKKDHLPMEGNLEAHSGIYEAIKNQDPSKLSPNIEALDKTDSQNQTPLQYAYRLNQETQNRLSSTLRHWQLSLESLFHPAVEDLNNLIEKTEGENRQKQLKEIKKALISFKKDLHKLLFSSNGLRDFSNKMKGKMESLFRDKKIARPEEESNYRTIFKQETVPFWSFWRNDHKTWERLRGIKNMSAEEIQAKLKLTHQVERVIEADDNDAGTGELRERVSVSATSPLPVYRPGGSSYDE